MKEVAERLNISEKTLYNYLNFLRSKGLINDHANNLRLESIKQHGSHKKKFVIQIHNDYNLFEVTCLLYLKLIEQKARKQAFCESVRRFGTGDKSLSDTCEVPFRPSFSNRTLAKLLNVSESKAFKVIKNLNRLGVIKSETQKAQLLSDNFTELSYVDDLPGYRFNIGSKLFRIFGQRIDFLQFPVFLKSISAKRYFAYKRHYT